MGSTFSQNGVTSGDQELNTLACRRRFTPKASSHVGIISRNSQQTCERVMVISSFLHVRQHRSVRGKVCLQSACPSPLYWHDVSSECCGFTKAVCVNVQVCACTCVFMYSCRRAHRPYLPLQKGRVNCFIDLDTQARYSNIIGD